MFKKNIASLKKSVEDQQNQIVGGGLGKNNGLLAEHIKQTEKNYKQVADSAKQFSEDCNGKYNEYVKASEQQRNQQNTENQKLQSELGEKLPRFCRKYESAQRNAQGACSGELDSLFDSAMKAATRSRVQGDTDAVAEFRDLCDGFNNESDAKENPGDHTAMCTKLGVEKGKDKTKYTDANCELALNGTKAQRAESPFCKTSTITNANGSTSDSLDCDGLLKQISATFRSKYGSGTGTLTVTNSAPSFCTAGDNSGRDGFQKGLDTFLQELNKARAGAQ